ncbi:unnamed protein product [Diamesa tonsa]
MNPSFGLSIKVEKNPELSHLNLNGIYNYQLNESMFHISPKKVVIRHHVGTHPRAIKMRAEKDRKLKSQEMWSKNPMQRNNPTISNYKRNDDLLRKENLMKRLNVDSKEINGRKVDPQHSNVLKANPAKQLFNEPIKHVERKADPQQSIVLKELKINSEEAAMNKTAERMKAQMEGKADHHKEMRKSMAASSEEAAMTKTAQRILAKIEVAADIEKVVSPVKRLFVEPKEKVADVPQPILFKDQPVNKLTFETKKKGVRKAHSPVNKLIVDLKAKSDSIGSSLSKAKPVKADLQESIKLKENIVKKSVVEPKKIDESSESKTAQRIKAQMERKVDPQESIKLKTKENFVMKPIVEPKKIEESTSMTKTEQRIKAQMERKIDPQESIKLKENIEPKTIGESSHKAASTGAKTDLQQSIVSKENPHKRKCLDANTNHNNPGTSGIKSNDKRNADQQQSIVSKENPSKRMCIDVKTTVEPSHKTAMAKLMRPRRDAKTFPLEILGEWNESIERFYVPQKITWMTSNAPPDVEDAKTHLSNWLLNSDKPVKEPNKKVFCDETVYSMVLLLKDVFSQLKADEVNHARERSNIFENFNKDIFIHHSAIKMANIDSMCEYMLTSPINHNGQPMLIDGELLYYADISAKLGGVSEYVMWRRNRMAKGFGFNTNNFKTMELNDMFQGCPKEYSSHHGAKGNGNILDPVNIESYVNNILYATHGVGVHFMMSDCSITTEDGQENIQETNSRRMYVAQCLLGLSVVRYDGHFVMKLLDVFTPFSLSLIFLMYKCFINVSIIKPNTSKTANSERYLVCKWRKPGTEEVCAELTKIYAKICCNIGKQEVDNFVPIEIIQKDKVFVDYIIQSNSRIGEKQFVASKKIVAFHNDESLIENRQMSIKAQCLELWNLNDTTLSVPNVQMTGEQYFRKFTERSWCRENFFVAKENTVKTINDLSNRVESALNWKFVAIDSQNAISRTFYMSRGQSDVLKYIKDKNSWEATTNIKLEMPAQTIVFGEIVKEYSGEKQLQTSKTSFHIIDAIILGGRDVSKFPLKQRNKLCKMFTESLTKAKLTSNADNVVIRTKELFKFSSINIFYFHLALRQMQNDKSKYGLNSNINSEDVSNVFYVPSGIMMMNEVRSDMLKAYSVKNNNCYLYDKRTRRSQYEVDAYYENVYASFKNTFINRFVWNVDQQDQFSADGKPKNAPKDLMYFEDIENFIISRIQSGIRVRPGQGEQLPAIL